MDRYDNTTTGRNPQAAASRPAQTDTCAKRVRQDGEGEQDGINTPILRKVQGNDMNSNSPIVEQLGLNFH